MVNSMSENCATVFVLLESLCTHSENKNPLVVGAIFFILFTEQGRCGFDVEQEYNSAEMLLPWEQLSQLDWVTIFLCQSACRQVWIDSYAITTFIMVFCARVCPCYSSQDIIWSDYRLQYGGGFCRKLPVLHKHSFYRLLRRVAENSREIKGQSQSVISTTILTKLWTIELQRKLDNFIWWVGKYRTPRVSIWHTKHKFHKNAHSVKDVLDVRNNHAQFIRKRLNCN